MDAWGDGWVVEDTRQTGHGFILFFGRPKWVSGPHGITTIITPEVADYFERHRRTPKNLDLPIAVRTVGRIRRVLGHNRYQDAEMWWLARIMDLQELTTADFCVRHRVSMGAVAEARQQYLSERRVKDANWWRTGEMYDLLMSKMPTAWIAQKTNLAAVTVRKYRAALAK